jgi:hypothetical protein
MSKYVAGNKSGMILEQPRKAEPVSAAQDISTLLNQGSLVLSREIHNLLLESAVGKLEAGSARDLVAYLKLLHELKKEQENKLANLTDEELERLGNE